MSKEQMIATAKQAAMELPKPIQRDDTEHGIDYYTADQLAAAVLAARNAALEEIAFRFEDLHLYGTKTADTKGCAAIIRKMKEPNA